VWPGKGFTIFSPFAKRLQAGSYFLATTEDKNAYLVLVVYLFFSFF